MTLGTEKRTEKEAQNIAKAYAKTPCKHYCLIYICRREPFTQAQEGLHPELNLIVLAKFPQLE